jgi:hypothetical protein
MIYFYIIFNEDHLCLNKNIIEDYHSLNNLRQLDNNVQNWWRWYTVVYICEENYQIIKKTDSEVSIKANNTIYKLLQPISISE